MKEIWKPVLGFEEFYEISSIGNVRSLDRYVTYPKGFTRLFKGQPIRPYMSQDGYLSISFRIGGRKSHHRQIHRMVAEAFCFKPHGCDVVNHIDCNRANNHFKNLEWTTNQKNTEYRDILGRGAKKNGMMSGTSKLCDEDVIQIIHRLASGESHESIGNSFKVSGKTISKINSGETWWHINIPGMSRPYYSRYPSRFKINRER
ncbi:NUMOD4 motif protein [Flyfo siphovirus Tbat2_3]|nr:NUMOD4 motif protein [Flyfo siphovirus Tbat2_3]